MKISGTEIPGKWIAFAALGLIAFLAFSNGTVTVGPGKRGVLMNWGAVQPIALTPGLHLKIPVMQTVRILSVRVQNVSSKETAASKDLQDVTTEVAVNFNLIPKTTVKTYQKIGDLRAVYDRIIAPAVSNAVKAVTAKFDAADLVVHRDLVRSQIEQQIRAAVKSYGIEIDAVNITDFNFSPSYDQAIENKQVAQQRSLQAKYELKRATINAQKKVVQAEADAKAAIANAKGEAKSELISARADAKAMTLRRNVLTNKLLELDWINHWDGKVPVMQGVGIPMINLAGMIGHK